MPKYQVAQVNPRHSASAMFVVLGCVCVCLPCYMNDRHRITKDQIRVRWFYVTWQHLTNRGNVDPSSQQHCSKYSLLLSNCPREVHQLPVCQMVDGRSQMLRAGESKVIGLKILVCIYYFVSFTSACACDFVFVFVIYLTHVIVIAQHRSTPLHKGASEEHTEVCVLLLDNGASINAVDHVSCCVMECFVCCIFVCLCCVCV